jgi:hypothetical protein
MTVGSIVVGNAVVGSSAQTTAQPINHYPAVRLLTWDYPDTRSLTWDYPPITTYDLDE